MKQSDSSQRSKESKYFDELRNENYDDSFQATDSWLRSRSTDLTNFKTKKSEGIFIHMKKYFGANKFRLAYAFLILAFVVAACNYPVTQQESAGDVLKWTVSKDNTSAINKIENLDWFQQGEHKINEEGNYMAYSLVIPKEDHENIESFNRQLEVIGVDQINLIPLNETIKRPVYSAVLNDLFKIDINASNMSDAELSKEIDTQLKNAGIENSTVNFINENGHRRVRVIVPDQDVIKEGGFDMTIKDGNNVTKMKEVRKTNPDGPDKFQGKSDEEIKSMVREDMNMPDLKDDQIEVIRNDGKVMVKINKSEINKNGKVEIESELK